MSQDTSAWSVTSSRPQASVVLPWKHPTRSRTAPTRLTRARLLLPQSPPQAFVTTIILALRAPLAAAFTRMAGIALLGDAARWKVLLAVMTTTVAARTTTRFATLKTDYALW